MEEKIYFDFHIGCWHFILKQNYEYTDRETKKVHMNKVFKIRYEKETENDYIIRDWMNFYTGWQYPCLVYDTIDYSDNRHNLRCSIGWGILYLYFPWRNSYAKEEDVNNERHKWGFYCYGEGRRLFDSIWLCYGKDGKARHKVFDMPWQNKFYRHSIYLKDGTWWTMLDKERMKARKQGINIWKDKRFYLDDTDDSIYKKTYPFKYVTKDGVTQETTATCYIEEREWRQRWLSWTSLFNLMHTEVNIQFADEMGNRRGSWKGGAIGVYAPMTKEERANADIESALRRYEEKVNNTKSLDR